LFTENRTIIEGKTSYIVPAYRCARTLERCLSRIPSKSEVIVVGRGEAEKIRSIVAGRPDAIFVQTDVAGAAHARNLGASLATGAYLAFLDADTYLPEDFKEPDGLTEYDVFVYTIAYDAGEGGSLHRYLEDRKRLTNRFHFDTVLRGYFFYLDSAFVIMERGAFFSNGRFNEDLPRFEDREFGYRLQLSGARIRLVEGFLPTKILDETATELLFKKIKDVYYQSKTIFTSYSRFLIHVPESSPFRIFKSEVRFIFHLNRSGRLIQFLYVFSELAAAIFFKFIFRSRSFLSGGRIAEPGDRSCVITCGSKSIFKTYRGEKVADSVRSRRLP
jgi:glycosyltransferase involved in cell wall biosynthesis